jgi:hypothetical protein
MITVSATVEIRAPSEAVFAHVDDIRNLAWHMTGRSSMAMMGSRLRLEIVSDQAAGLGATYRYCPTSARIPLGPPWSCCSKAARLPWPLQIQPPQRGSRTLMRPTAPPRARRLRRA